MSEDGFIAAVNENLDFLNDYIVEGKDYEYANFIKSIKSGITHSLYLNYLLNQQEGSL
tara:strand:+ start:91 stop:264 length:174 start_codon:yes stop_codon:yes gene_type:complete